MLGPIAKPFQKADWICKHWQTLVANWKVGGMQAVWQLAKEH
jgi:hypothetical protein